MDISTTEESVMTIWKGITVTVFGTLFLPLTTIGVIGFVVYYMVIDHFLYKMWA